MTSFDQRNMDQCHSDAILRGKICTLAQRLSTIFRNDCLDMLGNHSVGYTVSLAVLLVYPLLCINSLRHPSTTTCPKTVPKLKSKISKVCSSRVGVRQNQSFICLNHDCLAEDTTHVGTSKGFNLL